MAHKRTLAGLGLIVFGLTASLSLAVADDAPVPAPGQAPILNEAVSLQGFGVQNPLCREWSDTCSTCLRDEKDATHCSTPGIACQPAAIVCRLTKAQ
jgi:hypothetical protein